MASKAAEAVSVKRGNVIQYARVDRSSAKLKGYNLITVARTHNEEPQPNTSDKLECKKRQWKANKRARRVSSFFF